MKTEIAWGLVVMMASALLLCAGNAKADVPFILAGSSSANDYCLGATLTVDGAPYSITNNSSPTFGSSVNNGTQVKVKLVRTGGCAFIGNPVCEGTLTLNRANISSTLICSNNGKPYGERCFYSIKRKTLLDPWTVQFEFIGDTNGPQ